MVIGKASPDFHASKIAGEERAKEQDKDVAAIHVAAICCCLGSTPRLKIVRLLLAAYPQGRVVEDIRNNLNMAASTLSHHLHKLKAVGLLKVEREGPFLWYSINVESFKGILTFFYQECCCKNRVLDRTSILPTEATPKP